jgi:hypothetical protein
MRLQDWANLAAVVQVVAVAAVLYQLYLSTRLTRAANTQRILEVAAPFLLQLVQDADVAKLWHAGPDDVARMTEIEKSRYMQMISFWLLIHENVYHQNKHGLIDRETYSSWNNELQQFVSTKNLFLLWDELRPFFEPSFAAHIARLVRSGAGRPPPP